MYLAYFNVFIDGFYHGQNLYFYFQPLTIKKAIIDLKGKEYSDVKKIEKNS